jgi:hypothetical protein
MTRILSASATVRRREEELLTQARLKQLDDKLSTVLAEWLGRAQAPPAFTDEDVEEVGRLLVEGRIRLPSHARITVETSIETVRSKIFGTSELYTHTADQLHAHRLRPMSILAALNACLLLRLQGSWFWSEVTYKRLLAAQ